jgi:4-diphosphocytidyl-2-C-methyl-D-erythritol kinase
MQADHNLATAINLPISQWNGIIKNDFEKSVFPAYPEIEIVKQKIIDMGADYVSMSGSGSAVYGLFSQNDILSAEIKALFPQCDIFYNKF